MGVLQTPALPLGHVAAPWSGRRDSNSRPPPWQGGALPLSYFRGWPVASLSKRGRLCWCRGGDLNSYARKGTTPSRWRVCLFHHLGKCGRTRRVIGRSGGTRTPDRRFWRPLLFQLSYTPSCARKLTIP